MKEVMNSVTVFHEKSKEGFQVKMVSDLPLDIWISYEIEGIAVRDNEFFRTKLVVDSIQLKHLENQVIFDNQQLKTFFISNSLEGLQINWTINAKKLSKTIWLNDVQKQSAKQRKVKLKIKKIDRQKKTLILTIKSKERIDHFWIYSTRKGIQFEENDLQLFPGKKEINVHFQTLPRRHNFKWLGLEKAKVKIN
jgi:hypothetical protein